MLFMQMLSLKLWLILFTDFLEQKFYQVKLSKGQTAISRQPIHSDSIANDRLKLVRLENTKENWYIQSDRRLADLTIFEASAALHKFSGDDPFTGRVADASVQLAPESGQQVGNCAVLIAVLSKVRRLHLLLFDPARFALRLTEQAFRPVTVNRPLHWFNHQ